MTVLSLIIAILVSLSLGAFLIIAQSLFIFKNGIGAENMDIAKNNRSKLRAVIACAGPSASERIHRYVGITDCRIIHTMYSGDRNCKDACLGYGTCRNLCPIGAIVIEADHLPRVRDDCDGCGLCVAECPSGAIQLVPRDADFHIRCVSRADPGSRLSFCSHACTACGACREVGEGAGFTVKDGLARINYRSKGDRKTAAKICPTGCIVSLSVGEPNKNAFQGPDNRLEWTDRESGAAGATK